MTNNPTIDGVSPKRGDRLFHVGNTRACPRGWVEFLCFDGCGQATVRTKNGAVPSVQVDHLQWHAMSDEQQLEEFYSELSGGGKLSKRALCHIRALQSTIARLEARIAELKRGRGEPVAELTVEFFEHGPMATINWFTPSAFEHGATKVFTSPPAPVAVVPDERAAFDAWAVKHGRVVGYNGWRNDFEVWQARACLDATAALNKP